MNDCGPYVCNFPGAALYSPGELWRCPRCGTVYRLTRRKPQRFWRNWSAPHGHWVVANRLRTWLARTVLP